MAVGGRGGRQGAPHEVTADQLAGYAAGLLGGPSEMAVRRHLAGGCERCLAEMYRFPVGIPRPGPTEAASKPSRWPGGSVPALFAAAVVLVVVAYQAREGPPAPSTDWETRSRVPVAVAPRTEPIAAQSRRSERPARLGTPDLEHELAALRGRARVAERHSRGLQVTLDRDRRRLLGLRRSLDDARVLTVTLGSAGTRLVRLQPEDASREAAGTVIWNAERARLFAYVTGLPAMMGPWVLRVVASGGRVHAEYPLRPDDAGGVMAIAGAVATVQCGDRLEIRASGSEPPILHGELGECISDPACGGPNGSRVSDCRPRRPHPDRAHGDPRRTP